MHAARGEADLHNLLQIFLADAWKHRIWAWKGSWTLKGGYHNFLADPQHIWSEWWWPTERQRHKQRSFFLIPWSTQFEPGKAQFSDIKRKTRMCMNSDDGFSWNLKCSKIWMNTDARKHWVWARTSTCRHMSKEGQDWIYELWTVFPPNLFEYSKIQMTEPGIPRSIEVIQRQEQQEHIGSFLKLIFIEFGLKWSITPDGAWKGSFLGVCSGVKNPVKYTRKIHLQSPKVWVSL